MNTRPNVTLMVAVALLLLYIVLTDFVFVDRSSLYSNSWTSGSVRPKTVASTLQQRHTQWCPKAKCLDSPICQPCRRRFLIVLATGRSASTTLTWMLDRLPGIRMGGENHDVLKRYMTLMEETAHSYHFQKQAGQKAPFGHNPLYPQSLACSAQSYIETLYPPPDDASNCELEQEEDVILGFKTIRFHKSNKSGKVLQVSAIPELAAFLQEHFPCTRFVMNLRSDVEQQATSWSNTFDANMEDSVISLQESNNFLKQLHLALGDEQTILLDSAEWTQNLTALNQAVDWLGFDPSCHFAEVLEFNTKTTLGALGTGKLGKHTGNSKTEFRDKKLDPRCLPLVA